jgi:NADH-quinone oxidoreductase subunit F
VSAGSTSSRTLAPAHGAPALSDAARARIEELRTRYPSVRSALLPALKAAQAELGWLPEAAVAEVADLLGLPRAAAGELATFYSMLHRQPTGRLRVEVCVQLPCGFCGGERLLRELGERLGLAPGETTPDGELTLARTAECLGGCHRAPMCRVNDVYVENVRDGAAVQALVDALRSGAPPTEDGAKHFLFAAPRASPTTGSDPIVGDSAWQPILLPHPGRRSAVGLEEYAARGGYEAWRKALRDMKPDEVTSEVKTANLRGRGGAAFPAGLKWSFVPKVPGPKYVVCNADESEPGTFKDRELMEVEPHSVIEGMALASYAIGGHEMFLYIRGEYVEAADRLERAIAEAERANLLGGNVLGSGYDLRMHVYRGAGAYICGEETALLESLEGKRPMPRARPPFPAVEGLYARPTVVNNVETLVNVPHIVRRGAQWYLGIGAGPKSPGPKIFCLSGSVNRPGNYELPLGAVTFRELIERSGGGVRGGGAVKGVLPAGISAPIVPAGKLDTKLDYESVAAAGSMLGSASLIVLDDGVDAVRAATRMLEFFRHESCGKCTPCREGTAWLHKILVRIERGAGRPEDLERLRTISRQITGNVLCALGDFATSPVLATLEHFGAEYDRALRERGAGADWSTRS